MVRFSFLLGLAYAFLQPLNVQACGYGFVGDCSTNIGLRINGTADSFAVAPCPGIADFQGLQLGIIQSLALSRVKSINWESCQNNVIAVKLYYRVYQTGMPGGSWQTVSLQEDYNTVVGAYTTRYRSVTTNINLTAGLSVGTDYTLEAYFRADVDTIGNDFIPETFIVQDNDGFNYHLTFQYGGAGAPPFTLVNTKKAEPACYGDSTGSVSVGVYGNQTNVFYHWGYTNNNFNSLYNIPAGVYTLTVTGVNGFSRADTIILGQPAALSNQFVNLIPLSCTSSTGQVTAQVSGGGMPYTYAWSNSSSSPNLIVTAPGNYQLTVTDAHNCSQVFSQFIPSNGGTPVSRNLQAEICNGGTYHVGDQNFSQTGVYNFTLPGNGGCDTLVQLELTVLDAALLVDGLPSTGTVTCAQRELNLCAAVLPNATFSWQKDGVAAVNTACILATAGGTYTLTAVLTGNSQSCGVTKNITIVEHLFTPPATIGGSFTITCTPSTQPVRLYAQTTALSPTFVWTYNGQVLSTTDSCQFVIAGVDGQGNLLLPTLVVTDTYGCSTTATSNVTVQVDSNIPSIFMQQHNLCNGLSEVTYQVSGTAPLAISWNNPAIQTNPFTAPPGLYTVTVTAANGCSSISTIEIEPFHLITILQPATGSNMANGSATAILLGGSFAYTYAWSNGSTNQQIVNQLPGEYCVTATDADGCSLDTCVVISYPNAVQELNLGKIGLAPNPVTAGDWLTMRLPEGFVEQTIEVNVFDATGRLLIRQPDYVKDNLIYMQLPASVPVGVLLIHIRSATGQAWGRCVAR